MSRYFTNTNTFVGQDLNDLSKDRTFQPNEYWVVWPDGSTGMPEWSEERFREATEEEFWKFDADPSAIMHVSIATSIIHAQAECDGCFEPIPLGEEHRYDIAGVPFTYCKKCELNTMQEVE